MQGRKDSSSKHIIQFLKLSFNKAKYTEELYFKISHITTVTSEMCNIVKKSNKYFKNKQSKNNKHFKAVRRNYLIFGKSQGFIF